MLKLEHLYNIEMTPFILSGLISFFLFSPNTEAAKRKNDPNCLILSILINRDSLIPPNEIFKKFSSDNDDGYIYLVRGVAPTEAYAALEAGKNLSAGADGRITQRPRYGIENKIKPAYIMSSGSGLAKPTTKELRTMFQSVKFYADQGAAAEKAGKGVSITDAASAFPDERGYILVFRVPKSTALQFHPESTADVPSRVVELPKDAELISFLRQPEKIDKETGLPILE